MFVKYFEGINYEVEIHKSFKEAKQSFRDYTGFKFNRHYTEPESDKYSEIFSEAKIYELDLPDFLELKKVD